MPQTLNVTDYTTQLADHFKVFEVSREEPRVLTQARQKAMQSFQRSGFPTRKHEEWKYTNINKYLHCGFEPGINRQVREITASEFSKASIPDLEANRIVFINGCYSPDHSRVLDKELIFRSLADVEAKSQPTVTKAVAEVLNAEQDPFISLNQAFWLDGALIEVPDNTKLAHPIHLIYFEKSSDNNSLDSVFNVLSVGKNTKVQVIQQYLNEAPSEANLANHFTKVYVDANSITEWYSLQNHMGEGLHLSNFEVDVAQDSRFSTYAITSSGTLVRNTSNIRLLGQNSESRMYGLYQLDGKEHVDNRTLVDHAVPHCFSDELYKGILHDESTAVFNGKIIVRPDAQKTNAFQSNPNIVLSDDASIYSKPQLEIFADDVKCSHGATTGQLDEEALFYLRQRGLGQEDARALLIYAFANDIIQKINVEPLREYLAKLIQGKLMIH